MGQASVDAAGFEALLAQCRPTQPGESVADLLNHTFRLKPQPAQADDNTTPTSIVVTSPSEKGDEPTIVGGASSPTTTLDEDGNRAVEGGWSLLHEAVEMNRVDFASLLIKKGANVNIADDRFVDLLFTTALHQS